MTEVLIQDITIGENVRRGEVTLAPSFVASIAQLGIIEPLVVDSDNVLIAGHRRLAAAKELGLAAVPVVVNRSEQRTAVQVAENYHREDMTAWELAQATLDLKSEGFDQGEIAVTLSIPKKRVSVLQRVARLDLTDEDANQLTLEALDEVSEASKQLKDENVTAEDIVRPIVSNEERDVEHAARFAHHEAQQALVMEELATLQAEWAELGVTVVTVNPEHDYDKPGTYNQYTVLNNVVRVEGYSGLDVSLAKHIEEECHIVWIQSQKGRYASTSWTHYCGDKRRHAKAGNSELKTPVGAKPGGGMSQKEKDDRRADREAKKVHEKQSFEWLKNLDINKANYALSLTLALTTWREDDDRAAANMLVTAGAIEKRPTGAEWGWHATQVTNYLGERFNDDELKKQVWMLRFMSARKVIESRFPDDDIKALIEEMQVKDDE